MAEEMTFAEQVDKSLAGEMPFYSALKVCDTPDILIQVGCEQLPMLYTQNHLKKAVEPKTEREHSHGLLVEQIKSLPTLLNDPVIVADSLSKNDSIVVVTSEFDNDNNPIIASIKPNGKGRYEIEELDSNFITSVYGRNSFPEFFERLKENNNLLFCNKNKTEEMFERWGEQYSELTKSLPFDSIIHQSRNISRGNSDISERNEQTMTFYKNVDISDLDSILEKGLLSLDESGNDNWEEGKRANNPTDKVYLFSPLDNKDNSFPKYGLALLEVECSAVPSAMVENDIHKEDYKEYITDKVLPEQIKAIYIPEVFKERLSKHSLYDKFNFVKMNGRVFDEKDNFKERSATQEELSRFGETSAINSTDFNFFRGINQDNTIFDLHDVNYEIDSIERKIELSTNEKEDIMADTKHGIISVEMPDGEIDYYSLSEGITKENALSVLRMLEVVRDSGEMTVNLFDIAKEDFGERIDSYDFAEIEQSENCTFSMEYNLDSGSAKIYEINNGLGGISEGDRNDDNISFSTVNFSELPEEQEINDVKVVKLTGKPISDELKDIIDRLNNNENVALEDIKNTPEMLMAASMVNNSAPTIQLKNREDLQEAAYNKMMNFGSAEVDENGKTVYNGDVSKGHRLDIVIGLPASGKSSAIADTISHEFSSRVIDSDEAKKMFPEFNEGWGANVVHAESQIIEQKAFQNALLNGDNIVLPKVGSNSHKLIDNYIDTAKSFGYDVNVHFVDLERNQALGRMINRFVEDGRYLAPDLIDKYAPDNETNYVAQTYEELKSDDRISQLTKWDNDVARGERPNLKEVTVTSSDILHGEFSQFIADGIDKHIQEHPELDREYSFGEEKNATSILTEYAYNNDVAINDISTEMSTIIDNYTGLDDIEEWDNDSLLTQYDDIVRDTNDLKESINDLWSSAENKTVSVEVLASLSSVEDFIDNVTNNILPTMEGEIYNERNLRTDTSRTEREGRGIGSEGNGLDGETRQGASGNVERGIRQETERSTGEIAQGSLSERSEDQGLESVNRYAPPLTIEEVKADLDFIADSISKQLDNRDLITTEKIIEQFVGMNDDYADFWSRGVNDYDVEKEFVTSLVDKLAEHGITDVLNNSYPDIPDIPTIEFDKAKSLINEYSRATYGRDEEFKDLTSVELVYSKVENPEFFDDYLGFSDPNRMFDIQVDADLVNYQITTWIDGDEIRTQKFESLAEMNEEALSNLDFNDLITLTDEEWQEIADRELNKASEKALDEHEAEFGADGRRAFPHLNDPSPEETQEMTKEQFEVSVIDSMERASDKESKFREIIQDISENTESAGLSEGIMLSIAGQGDKIELNSVTEAPAKYNLTEDYYVGTATLENGAEKTIAFTAEDITAMESGSTIATFTVPEQEEAQLFRGFTTLDEKTAFNVLFTEGNVFVEDVDGTAIAKTGFNLQPSAEMASQVLEEVGAFAQSPDFSGDMPRDEEDRICFKISDTEEINNVLERANNNDLSLQVLVEFKNNDSPDWNLETWAVDSRETAGHIINTENERNDFRFMDGGDSFDEIKATIQPIEKEANIEKNASIELNEEITEYKAFGFDDGSYMVMQFSDEGLSADLLHYDDKFDLLSNETVEFTKIENYVDAYKSMRPNNLNTFPEYEAESPDIEKLTKASYEVVVADELIESIKEAHSADIREALVNVYGEKSVENLELGKPMARYNLEIESEEKVTNFPFDSPEDLDFDAILKAADGKDIIKFDISDKESDAYIGGSVEVNDDFQDIIFNEVSEFVNERESIELVPPTEEKVAEQIADILYAHDDTYKDAYESKADVEADILAQINDAMESGDKSELEDLIGQLQSLSDSPDLEDISSDILEAAEQLEDISSSLDSPRLSEQEQEERKVERGEVELEQTTKAENHFDSVAEILQADLTQEEQDIEIGILLESQGRSEDFINSVRLMAKDNPELASQIADKGMAEAPKGTDKESPQQSVADKVRDNPLAKVEELEEGNYNMIDGRINNTPKEQKKTSLSERIEDKKDVISNRDSQKEGGQKKRDKNDVEL